MLIRVTFIVICVDIRPYSGSFTNLKFFRVLRDWLDRLVALYGRSGLDLGVWKSAIEVDKSQNIETASTGVVIMVLIICLFVAQFSFL